MGKLHDLAGQKFGKLTVIAITNKRAHNGSVIWKSVGFNLIRVKNDGLKDHKIAINTITSFIEQLS